MMFRLAEQILEKCVKAKPGSRGTSYNEILSCISIREIPDS
jgi:hypothetical protein